MAERYKEVDPLQIEKRAKQIREIRYKVYAFICIVFVIFFWPYFVNTVEKVRGVDSFKLKNFLNMGVNQALFLNRGEGGLLNKIDNADKEIGSKEREITQARVIQEILNELDNEGKQYALANCLNNDICADIDEALLRNKDLLRAYIILNELNVEKMSFDQRTLLQSINEFILDFSTEDGRYTPTLLSINFGSPSLVNPRHKLYQIIIDLSLEIPTKEVLMEFMEKVEKEVSFKYPVLFSIKELNYNIIEYGFSQTVNVQLIAYYYQGLTQEVKQEQPSVPILDNTEIPVTGGESISGRPTVGQVNSGVQNLSGQTLPTNSEESKIGLSGGKTMGGLDEDNTAGASGDLSS